MRQFYRSLRFSLLLIVLAVVCALVGCQNNVQANALAKPENREPENTEPVHIAWSPCPGFGQVLDMIDIDEDKCRCTTVEESDTYFDGGCAYYKRYHGYAYCPEKIAEDSVFDESLQMYKTGITWVDQDEEKWEECQREDDNEGK